MDCGDPLGDLGLDWSLMYGRHVNLQEHKLPPVLRNPCVCVWLFPDVFAVRAQGIADAATRYSSLSTFRRRLSQHSPLCSSLFIFCFVESVCFLAVWSGAGQEHNTLSALMRAIQEVLITMIKVSTY